MNLDWSPLQNIRDPGQAFMQGLEQGRQRRKQQEMQNALQNLDPNNPESINALIPHAPQMAFGLMNQQADAQRQQAAAQRQALEARRGDIEIGAKVFREFNPQDEAGYQQALAQARQMGANIEGAPPSYDPQFVQGLIKTADALAPRKDAMPPNIQREYDFYISKGRPDLAEQLIERRAEGPPIIANNGDGTFTIIPREVIQGGAPKGNIPPPPPGFVLDSEGGQTDSAPSGTFQP